MHVDCLWVFFGYTSILTCNCSPLLGVVSQTLILTLALTWTSSLILTLPWTLTHTSGFSPCYPNPTLVPLLLEGTGLPWLVLVLLLWGAFLWVLATAAPSDGIHCNLQSNLGRLGSPTCVNNQSVSPLVGLG